MQTVIFLLLLFLITIFSILLFYKNKQSRVHKLNRGECPSCNQKAKTFYDEKTNKIFKQEIITSKILKSSTCLGVNDVEYRCKACGLKEVYSQNSYGSCGF